MSLRSATIFATFVFLIFAVPAQACNDILSGVVEQQARSALEGQKVCKGLNKTFPIYAHIPFVGKRLIKKVNVGIDKTKKVQLRRFEYCVNDANTQIRGRLRIRCATSRNAVVRTHIQEDFDFNVIINSSSCKIERFRAKPRGEIGRLIVRAGRLEKPAKKAAQKVLNKICG